MSFYLTGRPLYLLFLLLFSLSSTAETLSEVIQRLEARRLDMDFEEKERALLDSYRDQYQSLPIKLQLNYLVLLQDAQARSNKISESLSTRETFKKKSEGVAGVDHLRRYSLHCEAIAYFYLHRITEAVQAIEQTIEISRSQGDPLLEFHGLLKLGDVYAGDGKFSKAIAEFSKAKKVYSGRLLSELNEKERHSKGGELSYRIGHIYGRMFRHQEAISYIQEALRLDKLAENQRNVRFDYFRLGEEHLALGDLESSSYYFSKLKKASSGVAGVDEGMLFAAKVGLARVYLAKQDFNSAQEYLSLPAGTVKRVEDQSLLMRYYLALAHLALAREDFETALMHSERLTNLGESILWYGVGAKSSEIKARAYAGLGRHEESAKAYLEVVALERERNDYLRLITAEVEKTRFDFELKSLVVENLSRKNQLAELKLEATEARASASRDRLFTAMLLIVSLLVVVLILVVGRRRLRRLADYDALTKVHNRRAILRIADEAVAKFDVLSVLVVDVDFFKLINDKYGHGQGDRILLEVAAIANKHCDKDQYFGRIGGEEFLFILPKLALVEASSFAQEFSEKLRQINLPDGGKVTVSVGVSQSEVRGDNYTRLLEQADIALYRAKEMGRNQVCIQRSPNQPTLVSAV
ncbi:GGDEF domain-containing protein [uncultured Pseudoteredinibacter sp.]|uniref:GGDEF domain-containing protein n=1 Tax=uncultured Pseudoteredinibacter sp. TaxID=1641701 RepID=UPI00261D0383|nr:GGDEF domain-containing protein [uncultured Pseudoteredinibacter sp.]